LYTSKKLAICKWPFAFPVRKKHRSLFNLSLNYRNILLSHLLQPPLFRNELLQIKKRLCCCLLDGWSSWKAGGHRIAPIMT